MQKAYDLKALAIRLKAKGLIQAEDLAIDVYMEMKHWIRESAMLSENPYDDIGIPFLKQLDEVIMPQIDKIDGEKSE